MRRPLFVLSSMIFFIALTGWAADPAQALKHTLIVGASVSYGYLPFGHGTQPDPATILARRYGDQAGIVKHAVPGANSSKVLPLMKQSEFDQSTVAIGLDLFFWDSTLTGSDCDAAVARVEGVAEAVRKKNAPWILGRIPDLGREQACMSALNQKIDEMCALDLNCRLIDFEKIAEDIRAQGGLMVHGRFYTGAELQPDGLHLSPLASEWVADLLDQAIRLESDPYLVYNSQLIFTTH